MRISASSDIHLLALTCLVMVSCGTSPQEPPVPPSDPGGGLGGGLGTPVIGAPLILGELIARPGEVWIAQINLGAGLIPAGAQVLEGPLGLSLDPATMALSWDVPANARGEQTIRIRVDTPVGAETTSTELFVVGMAEVARATVDGNGARVNIDEPTSALYGGFVEIPSGAVSSAGEVFVIETDFEPLLPGSIITAEIGPAQQFNAPVTVALPYTSEILTQFAVAPGDLGLFVWDDALDSWALLDNVSVDTDAGLVIGETTHFSPFAIIPIASVIISNPAVASLLVALGLDLAGDWIVGLLALPFRLVQSRELKFWKGDESCEFDETTAIVIHGLLSSPSEFSGPDDLIDDLRQRYDNVITYQYPSGASIATNGRWLAQQLGGNPQVFEPGVIIDTYSHSMGGLVSRFAVEREWYTIGGAGIHIANLTTLGTPHRGSIRLTPSFAAESQWLDWILRRLLQSNGILDLVGGSQFLQFLNASPEKGWTKYRCYAGNSSYFGIGDHDGIVGVTSAIPSGLFAMEQHATFPQGHNELHTQLASGAGPLMGQDVQLTSFDPSQITFAGGGITFGIGNQATFTSVDGYLDIRFGAGFSTPPWSAVLAGVEITCADTGAVAEFAGAILFYEGDRSVPGFDPSSPFLDPNPISGRTIHFDPIGGPYGPCMDVRNGFTERQFVGFSLPAGSSGTVYRRLYL